MIRKKLFIINIKTMYLINIMASYANIVKGKDNLNEIPEQITKIVEYSSNNYIGYNISTNKREIEIKINDVRNCCESFGKSLIYNNKYIDINKYDISQFYGVNINNIIHKEYVKESKNCNECFILNLSIMLNNGYFLQFEVYNEHNRYYRHDAFVDYSTKEEKKYFKFML